MGLVRGRLKLGGTGFRLVTAIFDAMPEVGDFCESSRTNLFCNNENYRIAEGKPNRFYLGSFLKIILNTTM